jgi:ATP-binding cassette, subfamily B, bacterial PglK
MKLLWRHLSKYRKKQFYLATVLMLIASLAEVASLGAVIPFLGALTNPERVYQYDIVQPIIEVLSIESPDQLILPLTIAFCALILISGAIRLLLLYVMTKISFSTGADLGINIYRRTLYQDYSVHLRRNSSDVINGIIIKTNTVINGVIMPILILTSSVIILIGIISLLFIVDPVIAIASSFGFGFLYWGVVQYTRQQLNENSQCIADQSTLLVKSLQEGLGGIRDVLINNSQQFYCQLYRDADMPFRRASGNNIFISGSPRFVVESLGAILIASIAYFMSVDEGGIIASLPVLGALALGAQKILPMLQQIYSSYTTIKGSQSSFEDVIELLDQPLPIHYNNQPIKMPFEKEIELSNIGFTHENSDIDTLKSINLKIKKGSFIGFIGETGSGKSTLIDVIMGLLSPTNGNISIDGQNINNNNRRSWQLHVAHVPQNIYLFDGTVEENIAIGIPKNKINHDRVVLAAKSAQIDSVIKKWKDGYQSSVGEHGVRISGGQRQRIGIARALYKQADVLILDEATSALDNATELSVMKAIEGFQSEITVLIIAHRLTTLKNCDQIIKLSGGAIQITTYDQIRS